MESGEEDISGSDVLLEELLSRDRLKLGVSAKRGSIECIVEASVIPPATPANMPPSTVVPATTGAAIT